MVKIENSAENNRRSVDSGVESFRYSFFGPFSLFVLVDKQERASGPTAVETATREKATSKRIRN
jgi:hypothetical protein